jgi:hypothetical protein
MQPLEKQAPLATHPQSYVTMPLLAGRDFQVFSGCTTDRWFELWMFPEQFYAKPLSEVHIGRVFRWLATSDTSQTPPTAKNPTRQLDGDYLFKLTKVEEEGDFIEALTKAVYCATEIFSYTAGQMTFSYAFAPKPPL